jgi:tripartite-type tricarboxylate transporter receptor subunit TctC
MAVRLRHAVAAVVVTLAVSLIPGAPAHAQDPGEFYRGKRITMIVGYEPGSSYDISARVLSRHMTRFLPGQPTFVVQNMPAAGSIFAGNHLYNVAEHDGTVIGMIGRVLPYQAMLKQAGIRFDPTKFEWIGSPTLARRVCVVIAGAKVQKADDLFTNELIAGGTGAGSAATSTPTLLNRLLGMKFRVVDGYKGAANIILAMERREVEGICTGIETLESAWGPQWMASDRIRVLFNTEPKADPEFKAPTVFEYAKTDEQRQILRLFSSSVEFGQPITAPPNVPADRAAALREAFEATTKDPTFIAELAKSGFRTQVVHADEMKRLVTELMSAPPEIIERLKTLSGTQ